MGQLLDPLVTCGHCGHTQLLAEQDLLLEKTSVCAHCGEDLDLIGVEDPPSEDSESVKSALWESLGISFDRLKTFEKTVVELRFGLGGDEKQRSVEEVSRITGVPTTTVVELEQSALRKLREGLGRQGFR